MTRTLGIPLVAVTCLLLAGCGSSAGKHSASTSSSFRATGGYVNAANAICPKQLARLHKLAQPTTPEGAISYLPRALTIMHDESSQLAALHPPASAQAELSAGLASSRELAVLLSGFLHKLQSGVVEVTTFSQVQAHSESLQADVDAHLRRAGLSGCASSEAQAVTHA
jgi:hypothetical protein